MKNEILFSMLLRRACFKILSSWNWQPLTSVGGTDGIYTSSLILCAVPFLWQSGNGISSMNQFILQMTSSLVFGDSWVWCKFNISYQIVLNMKSVPSSKCSWSWLSFVDSVEFRKVERLKAKPPSVSSILSCVLTPGQWFLLDLLSYPNTQMLSVSQM